MRYNSLSLNIEGRNAKQLRLSTNEREVDDELTECATSRFAKYFEGVLPAKSLSPSIEKKLLLDIEGARGFLDLLLEGLLLSLSSM